MLQAFNRNRRGMALLLGRSLVVVQRGQRQQVQPLPVQQDLWLFAGGPVNALMGNIVQPLADPPVGRTGIQRQPRLLERGGQRRDEAPFEVAVKPFDLAFGLGTVRTAGTQLEAIIPRQAEQAGIPAVLALAKGIPFNHDAFGVVKQDFPRHPAKIPQRLPNTVQPVVLALMFAKPDIGRPAITQRRDKGFQFSDASTDRREVNLHLMAGWRFKPGHRLTLGFRLKLAQVVFQNAFLALIALRLDFTEQNRRRYPVGLGGIHSLAQIRREGGQFRGSGFTAAVFGRFRNVTKVTANSISRYIQFPCNRPYAHALSM